MTIAGARDREKAVVPRTAGVARDDGGRYPPGRRRARRGENARAHGRPRQEGSPAGIGSSLRRPGRAQEVPGPTTRPGLRCAGRIAEEREKGEGR